MKRKLFILSILITNMYSLDNGLIDVNTVVHDCACASVLSQSFNNIQTKIFDEHLIPLNKSLESLKDSIDKNINEEKEQTPLIKKSNEYYEIKIVEALEHLDYLKKAVQINSKN